MVHSRQGSEIDPSEHFVEVNKTIQYLRLRKSVKIKNIKELFGDKRGGFTISRKNLAFTQEYANRKR